MASGRVCESTRRRFQSRSVNVGYRPLLWHLMRYYAHFGHKDFILCLGYRGDLIREYFLNYRAAMSTDFVWSEGGRRIELLGDDCDDWRITFVDTGMHSNLGQRLLRVKHLVDGEETFLANYSDGLSDLPLDDHVARFGVSGTVASFVSVRPSQSFHAVRADDSGIVEAIEPVHASDYWINGGFFCLRSNIFDYMQPGEELVEQPFQRLLANKLLSTGSTTASGEQWTRSRTRLPSTGWRHAVIVPGWCGEANKSRDVEPEARITTGRTVAAALHRRAQRRPGDWLRRNFVDMARHASGGRGSPGWFSSCDAERGEETRRSAKVLLKGAVRSRVVSGQFRDGFLPAQYSEAKQFFEELKDSVKPDLILTHHLQDRHQDHRLAAELTWNTWRIT